jgi:hypothetical protein
MTYRQEILIPVVQRSSDVCAGLDEHANRFPGAADAPGARHLVAALATSARGPAQRPPLAWRPQPLCDGSGKQRDR